MSIKNISGHYIFSVGLGYTCRLSLYAVLIRISSLKRIVVLARYVQASSSA